MNRRTFVKYLGSSLVLLFPFFKRNRSWIEIEGWIYDGWDKQEKYRFSPVNILITGEKGDIPKEVFDKFDYAYRVCKNGDAWTLKHKRKDKTVHFSNEDYLDMLDFLGQPRGDLEIERSWSIISKGVANA